MSSEAVHGVLVVDKPRGPTSHDVVARVRRALGQKSVGHAGTLDPMATGTLVLAIGEATKLVPYLTAADKAYEAEVALGVETDTLDADGRPVREVAVPEGIDAAQIEDVLARFRGRTEQRAPAVSAIKVGGRALHARVRRGEAVEAPVRTVDLHEARVLETTGRTIRIAVRCGKGFYVRSLARDLGEALGTVAHLTALRRTESGAFGVDRAVAMDVVEAAARGDASAREALARAVIPVARAAALVLPSVTLTSRGAEDARHGRPVERAGCTEGTAFDALAPEAPAALFDEGGHLVAVGRRDGEHLRVARGFR